ncbi:hypothetical protein FKW77_002798 [Venturia effusa]|uniref:Uncharacterized protein n=1 Tax=Venturia effusa TaxID=50376 RepID=A0A517LQU6_9PEZI|nr:hypothetical protein FKW77_002798 [Venturia effusa]
MVTIFISDLSDGVNVYEAVCCLTLVSSNRQIPGDHLPDPEFRFSIGVGTGGQPAVRPLSDQYSNQFGNPDFA